MHRFTSEPAITSIGPATTTVVAKNGRAEDSPQGRDVSGSPHESDSQSIRKQRAYLLLGRSTTLASLLSARSLLSTSTP